MIRSTTLFHSTHRWLVAPAVLLAVALTGACGSGEDSKPAKKAAPGAPAAGTSAQVKPPAPPKAAVQTYRDETYGFAIESARSPVRSEQQVPTADGPLKAYSYMFSAPSAPGAMMVMVTPSFFDESSGRDLEKMLEDSQQGSMTSMGGTLVESARIELDGAVGRSFRFKVKPQGRAATGYAKVLVRGDTLYQVMVVGMDSAKDFQAQGEAFVDSFHFVGGKT